MSNIFESNQMNGGNKVVYAILAILLIAGMGVGGYYLGWFLDKQAAAKQSLTESGNSKIFSDSDLGIKFTYPGTWALVSKTTNGSVTSVAVQSKSGSLFTYAVDTSNKGPATVCDENKPNGEAGVSIKCTFISGSLSFARFQDSAKNDSDGEFWGIAEKGETTNPKKYMYASGKGFYYTAKTASDITELDNIMKSVVRTK